MSLFGKLFCGHEYEIYKEETVDVYGSYRAESFLYKKYIAIQQCKKCGKLKKFVIRY
jgi:hypothetical protein